MPRAVNRGVPIHYVVRGAGPPLVLQHGFTGSWRDWETFWLVDGLVGNHQLIMLDARGHGESGKPHDPADYGFDVAASDVVAVLDHLGLDRAHYYGYSFGGHVGWELGANAPERFASLAIGGAHPYAPGPEVWTRVERMRSHLEQGMDVYVAWRESQLGPWPAGFRERVLANDPRALVAALTAETRRSSPLDIERAFAGMTMPVLVVSGDDDELFAGIQAKRAAMALPDGGYVEFEAADHFALYVRSYRVVPVLRAFIARVGAMVHA